MKKARIATILLLGIMLVSGLACGNTEFQLTTIVEGNGEISPAEGNCSHGYANQHLSWAQHAD